MPLPISTNVYKRHTPLRIILLNGWAMGFLPEQTLREASNAGYARCVAEPALHTYWAYLDAELAAYEQAQQDDMAQGIAEAEAMNQNMWQHGTIDAPKSLLLQELAREQGIPVQELSVVAQPVEDFKGKITMPELNELWEADPTCEHDIQPQPRGGVKCTKCGGWFCF